MIRSLAIKNYALIQNLHMSPSKGLSIITGETGAGKSIMLGAVGLLLGNRADTKALFSAEEKCVVEGVFDIAGYELQDFFKNEDLDYEAECIIRREISPSGKSRAFINDTPVTLEILKRLGLELMDIHSQHESLQLGNNQYQLQILDLFGGHRSLLHEYQEVYRQFKAVEKQLDKLLSESQKGQQDQDYKEFLYNELLEAHLQAGELGSLEEEMEVLSHAELIKNNLSQLSQLLDEQEFSVVNQLKEGLPLLSGIRSFSHDLQGLFDRLNSASIELTDLVRELGNIQDQVELDPERLMVVKERIDLIFRLQQKHQVNTEEALITIREKLQQELDSTGNLENEISASKKRLASLEKELLETGKKLTERRKAQAKPFAGAIMELVRKLGIENGQVIIEVSESTPNPSGLNQVDMLFSANKGVAPQELKAVASGGEFSRLIFVIKYLLADKTALPTIIFDEIDTGVSGEIALQMISMMREMAKNHQVISISHLPQFAAGGDAHYFVYKDHSMEKSVSKIRKLENEERVLAIAQMIGGENPGASAVESARELLKVN